VAATGGGELVDRKSLIYWRLGQPQLLSRLFVKAHAVAGIKES
jgi:hypothetical protein